MQPYASTNLIKVYWLDDVNAGYGVWSGLPLLDPVKEALDLARALLMSRRASRWISSTEDALVSPPETQRYIVEWLKDMRSRGRLRAWADIPPRSAVAKMVVKNLGVESIDHGISFAQFASLEEAKAWINAK